MIPTPDDHDLSEDPTQYSLGTREGRQEDLGPEETMVYADDGDTYHLGCDLVDVHCDT